MARTEITDLDGAAAIVDGTFFVATDVTNPVQRKDSQGDLVNVFFQATLDVEAIIDGGNLYQRQRLTGVDSLDHETVTTYERVFDSESTLADITEATWIKIA